MDKNYIRWGNQGILLGDRIPFCRETFIKYNKIFKKIILFPEKRQSIRRRRSTAEKFSVVRREGERDVRREVTFYNLDAIIAVGYRVNSKSATRFRQWATQTLKEYIIKGFVLNDDMMKNGRPFGRDYFDELLERIKEIPCK